MKNQLFVLLFNVLLNIHFGLLMLTEGRVIDDVSSDDDEEGEKDLNVNDDKDSYVEAKGIARIIGGNLADDIKLYPYHTLYGESCSAAIIDKGWVITAAHCGIFPFIVAGTAYVDTGTRFWILRHYVHPNWQGKDKRHPFDYDFQLLEMTSEIPFSSFIQPVKIAKIQDLAVGKVVTVTGWGSIVDNGPLVKELRVIKVPIVSKKKCQKLDVPLYRNLLTPRMFCAGFQNGSIDACQGDSGGPAVADNKLYGLVSFGYKCALPNIFGVYANVVRVRTWIENTATFLV